MRQVILTVDTTFYKNLKTENLENLLTNCIQNTTFYCLSQGGGDWLIMAFSQMGFTKCSCPLYHKDNAETFYAPILKKKLWFVLEMLQAVESVLARYSVYLYIKTSCFSISVNVLIKCSAVNFYNRRERSQGHTIKPMRIINNNRYVELFYVD